MRRPLGISQSRADPSRVRVTARRLLELKPAAETELSCCIGATRGFPVAVSHTRAVLSVPAVRTQRPSGLNTAVKTCPSWRNDLPICQAPAFPGFCRSWLRAVLMAWVLFGSYSIALAKCARALVDR